MDSHTYGFMVEHGGYATSGIRGEHGPEFVWASKGDCVSTAVGMADLMHHMVRHGQIRLTTARDPDDGSAGVPAKV